MTTEHERALSRARSARYRLRHQTRYLAAAMRQSSRYQKANPEKHAAHQAVGRAVRSGRLAKTPCATCGAKRVQAHHPNGYTGPARLQVEWLCDLHHKARHSALSR